MNIEKLKKLGLSPYEAKCYLALLTYGNLLGKDLAKKSGVPPTSVYRNLESLQKRGFVQVIQKNPFVYQAVDPEVAVSTDVRNQKEELDTLKENTINELQSLKKTGVVEKQEEVVEIYSGRKQGYAIGVKIINDSKKEMLLIGSGSKQSLLDITHPLSEAVKRGVNCKYVACYLGEDNKNLVIQVKKSGVKIKHYPIKNLSLLIKDKEESLVVLKRVEERIVLHIKDKDLSQAHSQYFDSIWRKSTPV
jgi:sugar-specific transcriptional regulator TrmB